MLSSNIRIPGDEQDINFSDGVGGLFMLARGFANIWNDRHTKNKDEIRIQIFK